jgi:3-dehydroquinate synthase class II
MKRLWVNVVPYRKEIAIAALESGAEALVLPDGQSGTVRQFGKIKTVEPGGDLKPGADVEFIDVASKADEDRAASVPANKLVVLKMLDWTIIPIENLLARRGGNLLVQVANSEQAKLMVEILEKGVDGVVLDTTDVNEIKKTAEVIQGVGERIQLVEATVKTARQLGMGDRSCLDTCTQMALGEGMLVGNTASGFFLVHSESIDNPYVASRPFRVNAGAVHAYILTPRRQDEVPRGLEDRRRGHARQLPGPDAGGVPGPQQDRAAAHDADRSGSPGPADQPGPAERRDDPPGGPAGQGDVRHEPQTRRQGPGPRGESRPALRHEGRREPD